MRKVCRSLPPTQSLEILLPHTMRYRWKLSNKSENKKWHQVEKGLLPASPRRLVVVSSWQPFSLQCGKPTVERTRQRLPHTKDRIGKSILSHGWDFAEHYLPVCLHCRNHEKDSFIKWCLHVQQSVCDCASCMSLNVNSCTVWAQWKSMQFYSELIFCVTNLFL